MSDRVAVCIGINYDHFPPGMPGEATTRAGANALRFAEADARDMAAALQESGYDVVTLLGADATRDAVLDALEIQREKVATDGLLLVHFSGHGQIDPKDPNTAYLLPVDADPQKPARRAIPLDDLARRYLGTARTAITLLDCCHSGYAVGLKATAIPDEAGHEFGRITQNTFGNVKGRFALTACAGNERARELDRLRHGAFTYYALDWWRAAPTDDHNSLATAIARGLEREHLPALVSGGVTEGLIRLRPGRRPPGDPEWRQAIQPRLARLDEPQLRLLCFRLDLDYDALPGTDRAAKTFRLVFDLETSERKNDLSAAVDDAAARQARDRILAGRLAALDPARLPTLCAAVDLDYRALAGPDPVVTIRNLIAEAEWGGCYDDLVAAFEGTLVRQNQEDMARKAAAQRLTGEQATQAEADRRVQQQQDRDEAQRLARELAAQNTADRLGSQNAAQDDPGTRAHERGVSEVTDRPAQEAPMQAEADLLARRWRAQHEASLPPQEQAPLPIEVQSRPVAPATIPASSVNGQYARPRMPSPENSNHAAKASRKTNVLAVASLTAGVIGLLPLCTFSYAIISVILGTGATILGIVAQNPKRQEAQGGKAMAISGQVCGILAVAWGLIMLLGTLGRDTNQPGKPDSPTALTVPVTVISVGVIPLPFSVRPRSARFTLTAVTRAPIHQLIAAWSPDGKSIVTTGDFRTALVWDAGTGQARLTLTGDIVSVYRAAWSPDGKSIITASANHTVTVWDAGTGQARLTLAGHSNYVVSAAWSPDGKSIVTASWDDTAKVWDAGTGQERRTLTGHTYLVTSAEWSPDGKSIVTASWDGTARVWDVATRLNPLTLSGQTGSVTSAEWSPDGQHIVTTASQERTAKVWDAATGQARLTLTGHTGEVYSAAWSPDGKSMVTASGDHTAKVWDAATGQARLTLISHAAAVNSAAWSPDGQHIVTASDDGTAKVWDTATGQERFILTGHTAAVTSATWSPDGKSIVTTSLDGTAKIWDVP